VQWRMVCDWLPIYAICNRTRVAKATAAAAKREERKQQWDLHDFRILWKSHAFTGKQKW
jgi:hypothetical protein